MTSDLKNELENVFDSYYDEEDKGRSNAVIEDVIRIVRQYLITNIK